MMLSDAVRGQEEVEGVEVERRSAIRAPPRTPPLHLHSLHFLLFPARKVPVIAGILALLLAGCHNHRVVVTDQVSGRAVDRVVVTAPGVRAEGDGEVGFDLPADDRAIVRVQADGYQPWTSPAGVMRGRTTTSVILDPRWMADFKAGTPLPVVERKPCPCRTRTR